MDRGDLDKETENDPNGSNSSITTETNLSTTIYDGSYILYPQEEGLYEVPTTIIVLLSIFYGSISLAAVAGNSLVIWIIVTCRRMHNVTHYFIANLALADIVIGMFSIPFQFQAALLQRWNLPHFMCPFCPFVQMLSVSVSVFTLTAIAVDRHRAVLQPLSAGPSKMRAKIVIALIWLSGLASGLPMALALRVKMFREPDSFGIIRYRPFCENLNFSDTAMMYYRCILFLLQYVMPLCIISFAYARMAHRLWDAKVPGNAEGTRDANILKNKKKVIKMFVVVVTLFALCWLPLQTYNFLQEIVPEINGYRYINIIWFCFDWLAMSNSCYNPFIYGIYNEKFRREFQIRFPAFRSKHSSPNSFSESMELDRTRQSLASPEKASRCGGGERHRRCFSRSSNVERSGEHVRRFGTKVRGAVRYTHGKTYFGVTNVECSLSADGKFCSEEVVAEEVAKRKLFDVVDITRNPPFHFDRGTGSNSHGLEIGFGKSTSNASPAEAVL